MEGSGLETAQIVQLSVSTVITIASSIILTLSGTIGLLFRMLEKKNDKIIQLTESYIQTTLGVKQALENNTKVIEEFPETVMMHIKANK